MWPLTQTIVPTRVGKVKELHGELSGVVSQLSEKVTGVLAKQESEFMGAYRAHMFNVQKELQQLRARVDEAELAMKKNDRIRELERARDWCVPALFAHSAPRTDLLTASGIARAGRRAQVPDGGPAFGRVRRGDEAQAADAGGPPGGGGARPRPVQDGAEDVQEEEQGPARR